MQFVIKLWTGGYLAAYGPQSLTETHFPKDARKFASKWEANQHARRAKLTRKYFSVEIFTENA